MTLRLPPDTQAVFFDMDGTLIDSETLTDVAIAQLIADRDLAPPAFSLAALHGMTWEKIEAELVRHYPIFAGQGLAGHLQEVVDALMRDKLPVPIGGAVEAFVAASRVCITGIVSSSPRATIEMVAERLGLREVCQVLVAGEDVVQSKPAPEPYQIAAQQAQVTASQCLVFEDSAAGVRAAKEAGAYVIGVRGNRSEADTSHLSLSSDWVIADFRDLGDDYFSGATF